MVAAGSLLSASPPLSNVRLRFCLSTRSLHQASAEAEAVDALQATLATPVSAAPFSSPPAPRQFTLPPPANNYVSLEDLEGLEFTAPPAAAAAAGSSSFATTAVGDAFNPAGANRKAQTFAAVGNTSAASSRNAAEAARRAAAVLNGIVPPGTADGHNPAAPPYPFKRHATVNARLARPEDEEGDAGPVPRFQRSASFTDEKPGQEPADNAPDSSHGGNSHFAGPGIAVRASEQDAGRRRAPSGGQAEGSRAVALDVGIVNPVFMAHRNAARAESGSHSPRPTNPFSVVGDQPLT